MTTNPKLDKSLCNFVVQKHEGKVKPVLRLIKHWNVVHNAGRLESYHLETLALKVFYNHPSKISDHASGVEYFLHNAGPYFSVACTDMTQLGGPVDRYLSAEGRRLSLVKLNEARGHITRNGFLLPPLANELASWR